MLSVVLSLLDSRQPCAENIPLMPATNLSQIASSFYVAEIGHLPLLFHRVSGEVSSINSSAALLIKLAQSGLSDEEIIDEVSQAHSVSKNQVRKHIDNLSSKLAHIKSVEPKSLEEEAMPLDEFIPVLSPEPAARRRKMLSYRIANHLFNIHYPDQQSFELCQAILCCMETASTQNPDFEFDLTEGSNGWGIFINGQLEFAMKSRESFADYIRTAILDTVGATFSNWVGLHAAAVVNPSGKALLFAAPSGSGKSTLSVDLMLEGYDYLGDDSQILDLDRQDIWPFPTAANLKPGAWDLFIEKLPGLNDIPVFRADTRPVKFLPVEVDPQKGNRPYKAQALIFPQYSENATNQLVEIELDERIRLLSESGCYSKVEGSAEMSQKYIEYVLSLDAYRMEYESSKQAVQLLKDADLL